jgi:hypothetical protein
MNYAIRVGLAATAVVVAVAVVLVLGVPALNVPTDDGRGETTPLTPVEIAEAYVEARNAYDPEAARELLADDFTTTEPPRGFADLANLELAFELHQAHKFHYSQGDCREREATTSPEVGVVECDYRWTNELHTIPGYQPTPARFTFQITDGRIAKVTHDASNAYYVSWIDFLSAHPPFLALVQQSHGLDPEATREVIELLPHYLALYGDWVEVGRPRVIVLDGGRHLPAGVGPVRVAIDVPEGWTFRSASPAFSWLDSGAGAGIVTLSIVDNVYADPCDQGQGLVKPSVGPSVDELAAAIAELPGPEVSTPTDVTVDGYPGKQLTIRAPDPIEGCIPESGDYTLWTNARTGFASTMHSGEVSTIWIVDVDGARLMIRNKEFPASTAQERAELQQIFESIRLEPADGSD